MKVDQAISSQVLDRLEGSVTRLPKAIYRPGEDRCYKGDSLGQLIPQEPLAVERVVEPLPTSGIALAKSMAEGKQQTPSGTASATTPLVDDQQLKALQEELTTLRSAEKVHQETLDEMRQEVGKLVATSRRELVRLSRRIDELESEGAQSASPVIYEAPRALSEEPYLQALEQRLDEVAASLQQRVEPQQQSVAEDHDWDEQIGALRQEQQRLQAMVTQKQPLDPMLEQRLRQLERSQQNMAHPSSEALTARVEQISQSLEALRSQPSEPQPLPDVFLQQWQTLQQQVEQLQQQASEAPTSTLDEGWREQVQQQLAQLAQSRRNERVGEEESATPLAAGDGREKSIVEELRFEIGEVRKSSARQLEALHSKLNALTTSREVQQIVKHATTPLQQQLDALKQQIAEKEQRSERVSTAIRF